MKAEVIKVLFLVSLVVLAVSCFAFLISAIMVVDYGSVMIFGFSTHTAASISATIMLISALTTAIFGSINPKS